MDLAKVQTTKVEARSTSLDGKAEKNEMEHCNITWSIFAAIIYSFYVDGSNIFTQYALTGAKL